MFDIAGTLEDSIVKAKKLCNRIEVSVDGCDDIISLRKVFHIHRHLRDVLRELERDEVDDYDRNRLLIDGLEQAFKEALSVAT